MTNHCTGRTPETWSVLHCSFFEESFEANIESEGGNKSILNMNKRKINIIQALKVSNILSILLCNILFDFMIYAAQKTFL